MKKIYGIAFASAALMLASCSNESEPGGPNINQPEGPGSYLAINIMNPSDTRADSDYEIGTDDENKVEDAQFVILSKWNGTAYGTDYKVKYVVKDVPTEWTPGGNYPNTVEKIGQPVMLIPASVTGAFTNNNAGDVPNDLHLVVILNAGESYEVTNDMSEDDLLKEILDVATTTEKGLLMTNSAYIKDNTAVRVATIPYQNLMNTVDEAKGNPVDVYVERVVARADVNSSITAENIENNKMYWENNSADERTLTPVIKGLYFYHDPANSYLLKDVSGWDAAWTNANDAANFRSYWATMPAKDKLKFSDNSYNGLLTTGAQTIWDGTAEAVRYIHENTLGNADVKDATKVVVLAELQDKDGKAFDMASVMGQFTTLDGAAKLIAAQINSLGYRVFTGTENVNGTTINKYRTVAPTDLEFTNKSTESTYDASGKVSAYYQVGKGNGNRTYYELKTFSNPEKLQKFTGEYKDGYAVLADPTADDLTKLDTALKTTYAVSYWKDGKCYYYTDIKHLQFGNDDAPAIGVVRNHVYDITFTGISGFGTPVFNPDEFIIPTPPAYTEKDNVFLASRINIHKWRIVNSNNNIQLGK